MNEEITLPKVFEAYRDDFGNDDEALRFVWNYNSNAKFDIEQIVKVVKRKGMMIKYENL